MQYAPASSNPLTFTVAQATPSITWTTPAAITYGTALGSVQLDATADVPGSFSYALAAGTVPGRQPDAFGKLHSRGHG